MNNINSTLTYVRTNIFKKSSEKQKLKKKRIILLWLLALLKMSNVGTYTIVWQIHKLLLITSIK